MKLPDCSSRRHDSHVFSVRSLTKNNFLNLPQGDAQKSLLIEVEIVHVKIRLARIIFETSVNPYIPNIGISPVWFSILFMFLCVTLYNFNTDFRLFLRITIW